MERQTEILTEIRTEKETGFHLAIRMVTLTEKQMAKEKVRRMEILKVKQMVIPKGKLMVKRLAKLMGLRLGLYSD